MDNNIEILEMNTKQKVNSKQPIPSVIKKKRIVLNWQKVFCAASILFIIGCFIYYGNRLIKYYKIYNPKTESGETIELLANHIRQNSPIVYENDGLYKIGGNYIYKGESANNYIKISNLMFRIIKITNGNYIEVISDDYINVMPWNKEITLFDKSDISDYLNNDFLNKINQTNLIKTSVCNDKIEELTEISCETTTSENFVKLPDISDYLNSFVNEKTYIETKDIIWLSNTGDEKVYGIKNGNVTELNPSDMYSVKPVITLNNTSAYISGNGTKEEPFIIESEKGIKLGDYLKLEDDLWIVYDKTDSILKLAATKLLSNTYMFDTEARTYDTNNKKSVAEYLNNTYYNNLDYKDLLLDTTWYTGKYVSSYKDIYKKEVTAKVGMLNLNDLKFNHELTSYFLTTLNNDNKVYLYSKDMYDSKVTISRNIRPAIAINVPTAVSGEGTKTSPYILGSE